MTSALASLLGLALLASAAQGATKVRHYRAGMMAGFESGGTISLEIVFQNKRSNRKTFTPRRVTQIGLESVPLRCTNEPGDPNTTLLLDTELFPDYKFVKVPANRPKPGRYNFRFSGVFPGFEGTISATVDKPNVRERGTPPRAHGQFTITDLDSDPGHHNCASSGIRGWSAPRPEGE